MLFPTCMKTWRPLAAAFIFACLLLQAISAHAAAEEDGYRIGVGDRIAITVIGEEDLTLEAFIDREGSISYPFLGTLKVSGLTLKEMQALIVEGLKPAYLLDPRVTVQVKEYRQFFVNGEVEKPGGFAWQPGLTVRKAAALAGGFTDRAARSKLKVIRDTDATRKTVDIGIDDPVWPGDIVTVDQSFF